MNIVSNNSLIQRNSRIGQITSLLGLLVLGGGLYISFSRPDQFALSWGALLLGFVLSQIGIYFGNRWGRRPRPDELLNSALKGLDGSYSLYHYSTPASHLLVGPAGVWVLMPRHQIGTITYEKGRWRQRGGGVFMAFRKFFAQEGLGRPDLEIQGEVSGIQKLLEGMYEEDPPPVQVALVFTNEATELDAKEAPIPTLAGKKLKEFIRRTAKEKKLSLTKVEEIVEKLED